MSLGTSLSQTKDEKQVKEIEDLLNTLPHDILHEMFSHFGLDPKKFTLLSQTSRGWHQFISKFCHDSIKKYFPYLLENPQCHHWGDYQPIGFFLKECQYYAIKYKGIPLSSILAALNGDPSQLIETPGAPKSLAYALMMLNNHNIPAQVDDTTRAIAHKPLLNLSASIGRLDALKTLITNKAISKSDLERALSEAAAFNHLDIMDILLDLGLPLSLEDAYCKAAAGGHIEALQKLNNLKHYSGNTKNTALINVVSGNHYQALEYLLSMSSFHIDTLGEVLLISAQKGNLEICCLLLEKAPFITQRIRNQALIKAAKCGNAALVSVLMEAFDRSFASIFNMMIESGFVEQAEFFRMTSRIDHNACKVTAFILAANKGHKDVVKLLVSNFDISEKDYIAALKEAVRNGHLEIVKMLSQKKNKKIVDAILVEACAENQVNIVVWAISFFKLSHENFKNALEQSSRFGNHQIVSLLLAAGSSKFSLTDKFSALMLAVSRGHLEVVKEFDLEKLSQLEILELIKSAKESPGIMLHLLNKIQVPVTQITVKVKERSISLLAFVASFGSYETLDALLNNANWNWGNLRQTALDLAIAHNKEQNADLIFENLKKQNGIQTASRVLLPNYNRTLALPAPEEKVTSKLKHQI